MLVKESDEHTIFETFHKNKSRNHTKTEPQVKSKCKTKSYDSMSSGEIPEEVPYFH